MPLNAWAAWRLRRFSLGYKGQRPWKKRNQSVVRLWTNSYWALSPTEKKKRKRLFCDEADARLRRIRREGHTNRPRNSFPEVGGKGESQRRKKRETSVKYRWSCWKVWGMTQISVLVLLYICTPLDQGTTTQPEFAMVSRRKLERTDFSFKINLSQQKLLMTLSLLHFIWTCKECRKLQCQCPWPKTNHVAMEIQHLLSNFQSRWTHRCARSVGTHGLWMDAAMSYEYGWESIHRA